MLQHKTPFIWIVIAGFAAMAITSANAAVIVSTNFDGVSKVGSTATITSWDMEAGVDASTSFMAENESGNPVGYSGAQANALDVATSVWSASDGWDVDFTLVLDGPTASIELDTFDVSGLVTSSSGTDRFLNTPTTYSWTVNITGDGSYGTQSASADMLIAAGGAPRTGSTAIDISSLDDLVAGENYTISIGVRKVSGDSTYMALESIELNGTTLIPEPASLLLLGIGSLLITSRRRTTH